MDARRTQIILVNYFAHKFTAIFCAVEEGDVR